MIKLNYSFKDLIKNFILKHSKLKEFYLKSHPNSKYSLDIIIDDILFVLKSGRYRKFDISNFLVLVGGNHDLQFIGNLYFGILNVLKSLISLNHYFII